MMSEINHLWAFQVPSCETMSPQQRSDQLQTASHQIWLQHCCRILNEWLLVKIRMQVLQCYLIKVVSIVKGILPVKFFLINFGIGSHTPCSSVWRNCFVFVMQSKYRPILPNDVITSNPDNHCCPILLDRTSDWRVVFYCSIQLRIHLLLRNNRLDHIDFRVQVPHTPLLSVDIWATIWTLKCIFMYNFRKLFVHLIFISALVCPF